MASAPDIAALKDAVYNGCFAVWEENGLDPKMTFRQQDIIDLDVIPGDDLQVLLQALQALVLQTAPAHQQDLLIRGI